MPNYPQYEIYEAYRGKSYCVETMNGITVHRSSIFVSRNKSILNRLRNYFSFVLSSAIRGSRHLGHFDFLLCESPPLFLGYSALFLARRKKAKLIFNVSDLWPESAEKLGVVTNSLLLRMAYRLEARLYKRSVLVTGQTQGICANIKQRFPGVKTYWLPNGADLKYYDPALTVPVDWRRQNGFADTDVLFLYAGIIGMAQGLEIILQAASQLREQANLKFILLGSGPEKEKLLSLKQSLQLHQVYFFDAIPKSEMPAVLKAVNAAIIPLRKLDLFLGAIPSKLFETLSMQVPVLLGVDGEARQLFVEQGKCAVYFEPEHTGELVKAIELIVQDPAYATELGKNGRRFVETHFNRDRIARNLLNQLEQLV